MERKFKFTAAKVARILPAGQDADNPLDRGKTYVYYWDTLIGGFGLRVSSKGTKAWTQLARVKVLDPKTGKVKAKPVQLRVGRYPAVTLAAAHKIAGEKLQQIERGVDPTKQVTEAKASAPTFGEIAEAYIADCVKRGRGRRGENQGKPFRTAVETERKLRKHPMKAWEKKTIDEITTKDVADLLDSIAENNGERMSNTVLTAITSLFSWAVEFKGVLKESPVRPRMKRGADNERDRFLTDDEIRHLWQATESIGYPYCGVYRMLLLTGQRRGDVAGMTDAEVDYDAKLWTIPASRHKSGRAHAVPLTPAMITLLQGLPRRAGCPYLFAGKTGEAASGFGQAQVKVQAALAKRDLGEAFATRWTLHDIRRTVATKMQEPPMELPPHIIDSVQGRVIAGEGRRYMQSAGMEQSKRRALQQWNDRLEAIINPPPAGKILHLPQHNTASA